MVFKRPRNSRDDRSGRSANRASNAGDRTKKSFQSDENSPGPRAGKTGSRRPGKSYNDSNQVERKRFSPTNNKSHQNKFESGDKPASSFSGGAGERSAFKPRKTPYTGRAADITTDGKGPSGNKSFTARKKPYSGRFAEGGDTPGRSFNKETTSERKSLTPRSKPSSGPVNFENKPQRGGFKKPATDRPYNSDRPLRTKPEYDRTSPDISTPAKTLRGRKKQAESKDEGLIRLNRYISNAGICSRRKADELIAAGVVSVNGVVVSELGQKVDPMKDEIRYNGELLKREKMVYVLLNKPKDYITTTEDPQERRTVMHLVEKASKERIYPIGRLDRNTTGLLLMTNDGDLADKLSHPKNNISKLYQAELNKNLTQGDFNKIAFGVELEDGLIKPDSISYVAGGSKREIGIQIHSGKNRIVRRIFEHLGYEVVKLDRVVYANLTKKDLPRGRWRYLEESEVIQLKHLI